MYSLDDVTLYIIFAEYDDALSKDDIHLRNLKLNNSIREIFFNRFVHMFSSYDHFLIHPDQVGKLFL